MEEGNVEGEVIVVAPSVLRDRLGLQYYCMAVDTPTDVHEEDLQELLHHVKYPSVARSPTMDPRSIHAPSSSLFHGNPGTDGPPIDETASYIYMVQTRMAAAVEHYEKCLWDEFHPNGPKTSQQHKTT
jgi:hypothetical protein